MLLGTKGRAFSFYNSHTYMYFSERIIMSADALHWTFSVRFNLEGKFGKAFVFAEVSSDMPSGEFVYILVQDKANGRVFTVVDNRSKLAAARMAGGNKEGMEALQNLLGGGGSRS